MKKIVIIALYASFLIPSIAYTKGTKTFGTVIEFSYDATRNNNAEAEAFNQHINDTQADLIVIDFYSPSCGPCKKLGPCIADLAQEFPSVKFIKVNVNTNPALANTYKIRSVPQLFFFKDGNNKETIIGAKDKEFLKSTIRKWAA